MKTWIDWIGIVFVCLGMMMLGFCAVGAYESYQSERAMYERCLTDGHKTYECYGIMRGRSMVVIEDE